MELSQCLLCSEHCDPLDEAKETPFSLLGRQLKTVFVLRELLRLPPEKLEEFLGRSGGDHLHEWIRFCQPCEKLVEGAFSHFEQMVQIHKRFKKVQEKVLKKVKNSGRGRGHGSGDKVAVETREFVKNHDYGPFESRFLVGDWEADWQLEMRRTAAPPTPEVAVKEESYDEPQSEDPAECSGSGADDVESLDGSPVHGQINDEEQESEGLNTNGTEPVTPPAKAFPCPLCPLSYATKGGRWEHVQRRHKGQTHMLKYVENEKPSPCPVCGIMFKGRKGVNLHQKLHNNPPRPLKQKAFVTNKTRKTPVKRQNCQPELQEDDATAVRLARKRRPQKVPILESEMFTENGRTLYRCSLETCGKVLKLRTSFRKHKRNHSRALPEDKWLTCDLCQDKFLGLLGLAVHRKRAHPAQQPPPTSQPKIPRTRVYPALEGQKRWRRFVRPCPHCPYTGPRELVEAHVKRVHEGGQFPLHCELCAKGLTNPEYLKQHHAEKHFICGVTGCALQLESKEQLHAHQVGVHGREVNLFKCDECGKLWVTRQKRERHQRQVHLPKNAEGAEQHICEQCGKIFALREYLINHVWHTHKKLRKPKPKKESITE